MTSLMYRLMVGELKRFFDLHGLLPRANHVVVRRVRGRPKKVVYDKHTRVDFDKNGVDESW